jgi:predicted porin
MKKTLIALATLAATASFAQSTVTLSGTLQIGAVNNGKTTTQAAGATAATNVKTSSTAAHNTWATSTLNVNAVEDLGGGLRASAVMISGVGDGFAARERTLGLSGGFGAVRFGRFVPAAAAGFHGFSGVGSANLAGSIYNMSTAGSATAAMHTNAVNFERQDNVLQYTTPSFSGFTVNLAMVNNTSDSDAAALTGKKEGKQTSLHLGYAAGPLSVGFGTNSRTDSTEGTALTVASTDTDLQWIGASYKLGVATVFATNVTREAKTSTGGAAATTGTDASVNAFGVSVPMGAITLRASTYSGSDKRGTGDTDNTKLSGNQLSVSYALSKRTTLVAATGTNQIKRDGVASTAATQKITGTTLGLTHAF